MKPKRSVAELERLVAEKPRSAVNRHMLSVALMGQKRPSESVLHSMNAVNIAALRGKLKPVHVVQLVRALNRSQLPRIAEYIARSAVAAGVKSPMLSLSTARSLMMQAQMASALEWVDHGLSLQPNPRESAQLHALKTSLAERS